MHVGQVYVADAVVDEVEGLTDAKCAAHGIQMVHGTMPQLKEAATPTDGLSFEDRLCLILARDARWTCITNDGALRKACDAAGVNVVWGLEIMLRLVEAGGIPKQRARAAAGAIHKANPLHVSAKLLEAFDQKLAAAKRRG